MAPLRADVLAGDWRLFYLLWLTGVESGDLNDGDSEPLSGIGPLTGALKAFADFFGINQDLLQAAAESPLHANGELSAAEVRAVVAAIPDTEKTALLCRLVAGDPHVAAELGRKIREAATCGGDADTGHRTVGELRMRAVEIRRQAEAAAAARHEAERQRRARAAEAERRARLVVVRQRVRRSGVKSRRRPRSATPAATTGRWHCFSTCGRWPRKMARWRHSRTVFGASGIATPVSCVSSNGSSNSTSTDRAGGGIWRSVTRESGSPASCRG